ncbi:MAG: VCBS repeat-containing protein [Ignavibacteriaceae bacterium]
MGISEAKDSIKLFAAVERKLRKVSLLSISPDTVEKNLGEITFDSYPEKIFASDIDLNGNKEMLVCGSGFEGLSILYRSGFNLGEKKVITGPSFSEAIFSDLNSDGYQDIVAFNILENSLQFYFNNTKGEFRLRRSIQFSSKINQLQSVDIDKDGFKDIVCVVGNGVVIIFGDFQSAYERRISIKLNETPSKIVVGDFNNDGLSDLACEVFQGKMMIFFGKQEGNFFDGIAYLENSGLTTFTKFKNDKSDNLVCLFESGDLKFISKLKVYDYEINLVPAIQASVVKKFDYENDGIPDISFIDEYNSSLKVFLSNKEGIPDHYYSFPLVENHKQIIVDEFFKFRKIFYCYTKGTPLLEVIRYNFYANRLTRKQLYAPGEILDVSIQRIDSSLVNVYLVYNKNSRMYLGRFENRDLSVTFKEYPFVDRNVSMAELFIEDNPTVYYWKTEGSDYQFNMCKVKSGPNEYVNYFKIPQSDSLNISLYGADFLNNEYPSMVSFVQSKEEGFCLILNSKNVTIQKLLFNPTLNKIYKFKEGFFGETSIKGIINFTINDDDDSYIYKLVLGEKGKTYVLRRMLDAKNVSDYFFARLDKKNYYLVYSNKNEGCLSILSLKK